MAVDWREAQLPRSDHLDYKPTCTVAPTATDTAVDESSAETELVVSDDLQRIRTKQTQRLLPFMSSASPNKPR